MTVVKRIRHLTMVTVAAAGLVLAPVNVAHAEPAGFPDVSGFVSDNPAEYPLPLCVRLTGRCDSQPHSDTRVTWGRAALSIAMARSCRGMWTPKTHNPNHADSELALATRRVVLRSFSQPRFSVVTPIALSCRKDTRSNFVESCVRSDPISPRAGIAVSPNLAVSCCARTAIASCSDPLRLTSRVADGSRVRVLSGLEPRDFCF